MLRTMNRFSTPHVSRLLCLLSFSCFKQLWTLLALPPIDTLPPTVPDSTTQRGDAPTAEWPHVLSPLLYVLGAAVAFWGSAALRVVTRLLSLVLALLLR